jgi:hypothetical protein
MRGDPEPVTLRQLPSPAGFFGRKLGDPPQPSSVHRIGVIRLTVVPPSRRGFEGRIHDSCRADELQQEVLWIAAEFMGDLSNEGLNRPGMRHVVD